MKLLMKNFLERKTHRKLMFVLFDFFAIALSCYLAIIIRFDFLFRDVDPTYIKTILNYLPFGLIISYVIFIRFKLYKSLWIYAGIVEGINVFFATGLSAIIQMAIMEFLDWPIPRSFYFLYMLFLFLIMVLSRFSYRILRKLKRQKLVMGTKRTLIIGAGEAGNTIIRDIKISRQVNSRIVAVVDDDPLKVGKYIQGIRIMGNRNLIPMLVKKYRIDEIIIAIPSANKEENRKIIDICKETQCSLKILPGIYQLVNGEVNISSLREVELEDLLGRDKVDICADDIVSEVENKTILVTGGGGSIGSELCRQIASFNPKTLVIVDFYENNIYEIQNELQKNHEGLDLKVLIASVRNSNRIDKIFDEYKPDIVFHAAAHKHVPLMEDNPTEAIKNNVMGTLNVVKASEFHQVKKFVLISTDKAVNPTNIMGASKHMCEMIIQAYNSRCKTEFCAVRFGNVLGSNGSVVPLFKKQIEEGGPVTVTHPDIVRYFMTIKEAVSLVLQASSFAKGGEIFVLDMGNPVNIADMAKNLIILSGYVPEIDIKIEYTGLRPGEKMFEEILKDEEGIKKTPNNLIYIGKPKEFDEDKFLEELENLRELIISEPKNIRSIIKRFVPTYRSPERAFINMYQEEVVKDGKKVML